MGGVGIIIRNAAGEFVAALALRLAGIRSSMQAEAAVFALQWRDDQIILEGDALLVVAVIQNNAVANQRSFRLLLEDNRRIMQSFNSWKTCFVRRDANSVAHRLARFSLTLNHPVLWFEKPPDLIFDLLSEDGFPS